jgi:hypothetical protein
MAPAWLHALAVASLLIAALSAGVIAVHIAAGHSQHMWIMNLVWPLTGLYAGPLGLWAYFTIGQLSTHRRMELAMQRSETPAARRKPFWQTVLVGTSHCGSACTLGDILAESAVTILPVTILGSHVLGTWTVDYAAAFLFGIAFQYFTIVPMRDLSPGEGVIAAVKADAASLTGWQVGMYGWMALVTFVWFGELPKSSPVFWFMMQIAMLAGFLTSYPINRWLIRRGVKEPM